MTASELKYQVEAHGNEPHFFTRSTMKFFGDTMRNYGVYSGEVESYSSNGALIPVWVLYRKHAVKHGVSDNAYFAKDDFRRVFPKR